MDKNSVLLWSGPYPNFFTRKGKLLLLMIYILYVNFINTWQSLSDVSLDSQYYSDRGMAITTNGMINLTTSFIYTNVHTYTIHMTAIYTSWMFSFSLKIINPHNRQRICTNMFNTFFSIPITFSMKTGTCQVLLEQFRLWWLKIQSFVSEIHYLTNGENLEFCKSEFYVQPSVIISLYFSMELEYDY